MQFQWFAIFNYDPNRSISAAPEEHPSDVARRALRAVGSQNAEAPGVNPELCVNKASFLSSDGTGQILRTCSSARPGRPVRYSWTNCS